MRWNEKQGLRWLEADLPDAGVAFSTRLGGVSTGSYESLNLGVLTDDRLESVVDQSPAPHGGARARSGIGRDRAAGSRGRHRRP